MDLTNELAKEAGITKTQAKSIVETFLSIISQALSDGDKVVLSDFGSLRVCHRKAFTGMNPKDGSIIHVPPKRIPTFRAGKGLKEAQNS